MADASAMAPEVALLRAVAEENPSRSKREGVCPSELHFQEGGTGVISIYISLNKVKNEFLSGTRYILNGQCRALAVAPLLDSTGIAPLRPPAKC